MKIKAFVALSAVCLAVAGFGCGGGGGGGGSAPPLLITATVTSGIPVINAVVICHVEQSGGPVNDAIVTVNSTTIPSAGSGNYTNGLMPFPTVINPGDNVILSVSRAGATAGATLLMPEQANITSPASASDQDATASINVQWDALSPTPDTVYAVISSTYTKSGTDWTQIVLGTTTTMTIPANTLKTNQTGITLAVSTANLTTSLGAQSQGGSSFSTVYPTTTTFNTLPPEGTTLWLIRQIPSDYLETSEPTIPGATTAMIFMGTPREWVLEPALTGDITGTKYRINLWAYPNTTTFSATIILRSGTDTVLANWIGLSTTSSTDFELVTAELTGPDPACVAGDKIVLRIGNGTATTLQIKYDDTTYNSNILVPVFP